MKELDIKYSEIRLMRELLIEEMRSEFQHMGVELLKLVEMRLQTVIMAGIVKDDVAIERKNFKG